MVKVIKILVYSDTYIHHHHLSLDPCIPAHKVAKHLSLNTVIQREKNV